MKHLLILISYLLLSSPVIGQSSKYESVSQCVLQTMEERGLTGNDMFKMVKEECERSMGRNGSRSKKKKGVLFQSSGKLKWLNYRDENTIWKYEGEIKNGKPHGKGIVYYDGGNKYEGEWKYGKRHGKGTLMFYDGRKQVGVYKKNFPWNVISYDISGKIIEKIVNSKTVYGVLYWKELNNSSYGWVGVGNEKYDKECLGPKYVGVIKNGKPNGQGELTYCDGVSNYIGKWKDGERHGYGTSTLIYGYNPTSKKKLIQWYEGEFKDGRYQGLGIRKFSFGGSEIGEFKESSEWNLLGLDDDGNVIYKYVNGRYRDRNDFDEQSWGILYFGNRNGKSGYYKEKWEGKEDDYNYNGSIEYLGEIKDGLPNGQGIQTNELVQTKYVGEWKDGKKHGKGIFFYFDGSKYLGKWRDGREHGKGTFSKTDGDEYVGKWKNGGVWNGLKYDKNGKIRYKIVNGQYISQ